MPTGNYEKRKRNVKLIILMHCNQVIFQFSFSSFIFSLCFFCIFSSRKIDIIKIDGCLGVRFFVFVYTLHWTWCSSVERRKNSNVFHWLIKNIDLNVRFTIEIDSNEEIWVEYGALFVMVDLITRRIYLKNDSYLLWAKVANRSTQPSDDGRARETDILCAHQPVTIIFVLCWPVFMIFSPLYICYRTT